MKWSLSGKLNAVGLGLALLLMGFVNFVSYRNATQLTESAQKLEHTHKVVNNLINVFATLTDAESGRRGYILFGNESELERYNRAIQSIEPKLTQLRQLLVNSPSQQQRLLTLESLIAQRLALFEQSINLYKQGKSTISAQTSLVAKNNNLQYEIRKIITQMQSEEEQVLEQRISNSKASIRNRMLIEFLGTILSFAILLGVYALLYQQMVKRQKAEVYQQKLTQEKELSDLKLRFFSMVSHEFRTPLSIILGSAQMLAESSQPWSESKKQKNLHRIQSSARLMTQLLTDILTLTRAEAGKLECRPELVDLESFCLNLVEDINLDTEPRHSIKFVSQGHCTHALLDEKLLYSILGNLLSNAIKYSPQGGNIHLILSCEPQAVIFQVKDEGIGIPKEDIEVLYEPFYRSKNVGNIVGTGLGLAVVKKCLELHGGQISVESEVESGTTFTLKIPQGDS